MTKKTRKNNSSFLSRLFGGTTKKRHTEPAFPTSGYRPWYRFWRPDTSGPNENIKAGAQDILNRSRDLSRKFPLINGAYDTIASNLVGCGIRALSQAKDAEMRKHINAAWKSWCKSCDIEGVHSFAALFDLAVVQRYEAGEIFIRHIFLEDAENKTVPYKLQLLEAEMIPFDKNEQLPDGNVIIAGIEYDDLGRRVAYHIYKHHPGDAYLFGGLSMETSRVPAAEILHYFKPARAGQGRGLPQGYAAHDTSRDLLTYDKAEVARKVVASSMTGFVQTDEQDYFFGEDDDNGENIGASPDAGMALGEITPGMMHYFAPGQKVDINPPAESGASYEPFLKHNHRSQAAPLGLTYEQLTGDLSGVNFSSIRAGLNEVQRKFRKEQSRIIYMLCEPIWEIWFEQAVLCGVLDLPGYALNPGEYNGVRFYPPGWAYVNPVQEVQAQVLQIDNKLKSRSQVITEMGGDPNEVDEMIRQDDLRAKALGLPASKDKVIELDEKTETAKESKETGGGQQKRPPTRKIQTAPTLARSKRARLTARR